MTELTMMTAEELAEARSLSSHDMTKEYYRTLAPRLLATVDALTQRAERAEGENRTLEEDCARIIRQRDELSRQNFQMAKERDAALALADARGRALAELVRLKDMKDAHFPGSTPEYESRKPAAWAAAREALALTPPQALREQQEREAEKDALIETLRGALEALVGRVHDGETCWELSMGESTGSSLGNAVRDDCQEMRDAKAVLEITPPQALREWEERVGALVELLTQALPETMGGTPDLYAPSGGWEYWEGQAREVLDAVKGGR